MEELLVCGKCGNYGTDAGCDACGVIQSDLYWINPAQDLECSKCRGQGWFTPCDQCGKQRCSYVDDDLDFHCMGFGTPNGCPECGYMHPLYEPSIPENVDYLNELENMRQEVTNKELFDLIERKFVDKANKWVKPSSEPESITPHLVQSAYHYFERIQELDEDILIKLSEILESEGLTEECENAEIYLQFKDSSNGIYTFYSDGGDAYSPACLFYYTNDEGTNLVHIPVKSLNQRLLDDIYLMGKQVSNGDTSKLDQILGYLVSSLNYPCWQRLDLYK